MATTKVTLLPCPLCGGEANNKGHGISCRKCGLWLGDGTQARENGGVVKLWNTRAKTGTPSAFSAIAEKISFPSKKG